MTCSSCGRLLVNGDQFCRGCGARSTLIAEASAHPGPGMFPCVNCDSPVDTGRACARCAHQHESTPAVKIGRDTTCSPRTALQVDWTNRVLNIGLWVIAILLGIFFIDSKNGGSLVQGVRSRWSIDGRYVSGDLGWPSTVRIDGGQGSIDIGVMSSKGMRVERHGDTLRFSGGTWLDNEGRVIPPESRKLFERGDQVELFTLADDGQTLVLRLDDRMTARFVKQP